mmetsp:Transcript_14032/g.41441  ORF Transcript_14032/g.41441 Transcript_14032/m.41441 type:complete len:209 (+) Transcript_14032:205-831(+)
MSRKICSRVHCVTEASCTGSDSRSATSAPNSSESGVPACGTVSDKLGGSTSATSTPSNWRRSAASTRSTAASACSGCSRRSSLYPCPYRDLSACREPTQRSRPSAMIAIRSARSSASSRKCVVSTTVRPRLTSRSSAQMARRECGSMPEVGSSRKRVRAPPAGWRGPDEWMAGCGGPRTRGVCVRSRPQATQRGRACASGRLFTACAP